jgi:hypothetical protein
VSALTRILFPLPDYRRTPVSLLRWWESRRLAYNAAVGGAGLVTLGVVGVVGLLPPALHPRLFEWPQVLAGVVVYGVLANVGYSLGWTAEMAMRLLWKEEAPDAGPALFRQGLSFAVGLTLLPIPLVTFSWLARALAHLF